MSEFNEANWRDALLKVIVKATIDPEFRLLCVESPVAAIGTVSDITLPPDFNVHFVNSEGDMNYYFLLPPTLPDSDVQRSFDEWVEYLRFGPGTRFGPTTHTTLPI